MVSVRESNSDAALSITTLGAGFVVAGKDGVAPRKLESGKPLALLVYLALSPGLTASRDSLLDLLWTDVDPEKGRHAMRQTIWALRRDLGESALVSNREMVRIGVPVETDRDAFMSAVDRQGFEEAVSLYRGDFLPNFSFPGAVEFEHWADLERQRLRSAFLRAGQSVVRSWLSVARHRDATALAKRLRAADDSESSSRLVLECLLAASDRVAALLEADAFERFIAAEEREPEAATRAMLQLVRQGSSTREATKPALAAELIGRETEFATLVAAWDAARVRGSQHVHVAGPAGMGKSRLLADFVARLRSQRSRVAFVGGRYGEREIGYSLASEVARALAHLTGAAGVAQGAAASLVALNPSLSTSFSVAPDTAQGDEALRRRTIAVRELLATVSEERPLALIIDDWHWADETSQRLLDSAFQRLGANRVLIVTAGRPGYAAPEGSNSRRIDLRPLSVAEVGAVIASLGRVPDEGWGETFAREVHTGSDGSPLLVLETLQLLIDEGVASLEADLWHLGDAHGLQRIGGSGTALRHRLASLDRVDRGVLAAVSVAGVAVPGVLLGRVLEISVEDLNTRRGHLEQRGFLTRHGDLLALTHDAIGESALAALSADERRALEQAVGAATISAASADGMMLLRGGRHLLTANDMEGATSAFDRWLRDVRRDGDSRPLRRLALEFAGPSGRADQVAQLESAAPFSARFSRGQWRTAGVIGVAATLLAAIVSLYKAPAPTPAEAELAATIVMSPTDTVTARVDIRATEIERMNVIDVAPLTKSRAHFPVDLGHRRLSPDLRTWAGYETFPDSGGLELVAIDARSGETRRLTYARSDDLSPDWSPTGDRLVFSTGRFDADNHNNLAILDLKSGAVHQLTRGIETDAEPIWNPRGDMVAFMRRYWEADRRSDLCFVWVDDQSVACSVIPEIPLPQPLGWYDGDHLLVASLDAVSGPHGLALIDVRDRHVRWVLYDRADAYRVSPDGHWIACLCVEKPDVPARWKVLPVDQPNLAKEVVFGPVSDRPMTLTWVGPRPRRSNIVRLAISNAADTIPLGASFQLSAIGKDGEGQSVAAARVRWKSSDSTVASVDSAGLVRPVRKGTVRIDATAGDLVGTHRVFVIAEPSWSRLIAMDWDHFSELPVLPFGDPMPAVVPDRELGAAFFNNGDGSLTSGIVSTVAFDGVRGLGLEARVAVPMTKLQWQQLSVALDPDVDSVAFAMWDRKSGPLPSLHKPASNCGATIPSQEGPAGIDSLSIAAARNAHLAHELFVGRPFTLRVQLFPDGRCGIAINGKPVAIVPLSKPASTRYRLRVDGRSVGTRLLVGRTEMWSGVRPGVNWLPDAAAPALTTEGGNQRPVIRPSNQR